MSYKSAKELVEQYLANTKPQVRVLLSVKPPLFAAFLWQDGAWWLHFDKVEEEYYRGVQRKLAELNGKFNWYDKRHAPSMPDDLQEAVNISGERL